MGIIMEYSLCQIVELTIVFFVNPEKRAIIPLSKAHISRSLRRTIIKKKLRN